MVFQQVHDTSLKKKKKKVHDTEFCLQSKFPNKFSTNKILVEVLQLLSNGSALAWTPLPCILIAALFA